MTAEERAAWLERLVAGERRALARLLTMAESRLPRDGETVNEILGAAGGLTSPTVRVGITGIPGAGKSTLIEELGSRWVSEGHKVAVLAVDPSSVLTGGSVLGDKLRMPRLSACPRAFVRPIPSAGTLGGVSAHLDECAQLCAVAGYDRILVETVGVGQSELDVALVCDVLVSVVVAGTGDDVQAMKRGLWEVTDVLAVNKVDGETEGQVGSLLSMYRQGLGLFRGEPPPVIACSALTGSGMEELSVAILERAQSPRVSRDAKRKALFRRLIDAEVVRRYWEKVSTSETLARLTAQVGDGETTLRSAVEEAMRL